MRGTLRALSCLLLEQGSLQTFFLFVFRSDMTEYYSCELVPPEPECVGVGKGNQ